MRNDGLRTRRGLISALALGAAGLALAWLCCRTAIIQLLPPTSRQVAWAAPRDADVVLGKATAMLMDTPGLIRPAELSNVRRAAAAAPLDARPYLVLGRQQIVGGHPRAAIAILEAGQRLDARQRFIHALLLEQYLKSAQYEKAVGQFSILSRLVSSSQTPIAKAISLLSTVPDLRDAVRHTLHMDPALERSVLSMMAGGDASPADIFDLASPTGIAHAGDKDSWGPVLVARLAAGGQYDAAHMVWQRIFRLSNAQAGLPIFNPTFQKLSTSPPFDWDLVAGSLGAADPHAGGLAIDYYGRDSGDLATQLVLIRPGRYRFSFVVEGGTTSTTSPLSWRLACASGTKAVLMDAPVVASPGAHRMLTDFTVPANCSAQTLTLHGEAGEFPVPVNTSVRDLALRPISGVQP